LAAPSTVTFADIAASAPFAAEYAARGTTGAFAAVEKKFNTKINFTTVATPQDSANAMLGGTVDVSFAALQSYLIIQASGKNVVATIAPFVGGGGVIIGAKKYEQSRGTDLSKFSGATFGYTKEGSASQLYMQSVATKAGLNWASTPHVAFGSPSAGLPLLEAGRIDVAAVDPTTASKAIAAGTAYLILNFNDAKTAGPIGQQLGTVYGFNKSFTTKYPDLTKALVQAMLTGLKAVKKVANDPAAVLALFPSDIQTALSSGWAGSWQLSEPGVVASDGTMSAQSVSATLQFTQTNGLITAAQAATASTVVDNEYVS
jgi:ABC-type nitrate/sulfonate/bicarbonate transport system substrate-binding protein